MKRKPLAGELPVGKPVPADEKSRREDYFSSIQGPLLTPPDSPSRRAGLPRTRPDRCGDMVYDVEKGAGEHDERTPAERLIELEKLMKMLDERSPYDAVPEELKEYFETIASR